MIKPHIALFMGLQVDTAVCITGLLYTHAKAAGSYLSASRGVSHRTEDPQPAETEKENTVRRPLSVTSRSLQFTAEHKVLFLNATLARLWLNFELLLHEVHKMLPNPPFTHRVECV